MDNIKTEDDFLAMMGLVGLEGQEREETLEDLIYTLNMRVGKRLAAEFTDEQAKQFSELDEEMSIEELSSWLGQNVPNGAQIIEEEAQKMKQEAQDAVDRTMSPEDK